MDPSGATTVKIIKHKSLLDYYFDCGPSIHFIALSAILFLLLAVYIGSRKSSTPFFITLLAYSFLPIIIGIFGCADKFQTLLQNLGMIESPWQRVAGECLNPLLAGSFLSALFLFITPIIILISTRRSAPHSDQLP